MLGLKKKHALVKTEKREKGKVTSKGKSKVADDNQGKSIAAWSFQPAAIAFISVIALALLIELYFVQSVEKDQQNDINQNYASLVQSDLNFMIQERLDALKSVATNNVLMNGFSSDKTSHQLMKASFSDLVGLYVIPESQLGQARTIYPDLGYASVDAVRKAQDIDKLRFDAFFDGKSWFYQAAVRVENNDPAVVLFVFDLSEISKEVQIKAQALQGSLTIYGGVDQSASKVFSAGSSVGGEEISKSLNIGNWQLRYLSNSSAIVAIDRTLLWIMLSSAALSTLVLVYLVCRFRLQKVHSDVVLADSLVQSAISGERKSTQRLHFSETISLVTNANQALSTQEQKVSKKPKPSAPAAEEELPVNEPLAELVVDEELEPEHDLSDELNFDDLDLDEELGLNETTETVVEEKTTYSIESSIFRAYDIRGIVDETLTDESVELIGRALASEALAQGQSTLCVGYDGRLSSRPYCEAICRGITSAGADAIVIGQVPTPVLYFATHHLNTGTGVMITGSHNPSNYNGFKMMVAGNTLSGPDIQALYNRIVNGDLASGSGTVSEQNVDGAYQDTIVNDVAVAAPLKVVVDAGNGVAGELAPKLIEELGCDVVPLFCEIDGTFPNHHPDPGKPENLQDLIAAVQRENADLGLAFDGDGDRVGVVTNSGKIIWPDRLLMLFAKDVVSRNPGADIIYDVKCSRRLNGLVASFGGRPIMWKTGHSLIKAKMKETGALLAGEMSGHIFFKERWFGFDDGLYSAVRLLEILGIEDRSADEVFAEFPEDTSTPEINITVTDETKFELIEKLCGRAAAFEDGSVSTIDGLRVDFADGWGLCRASNTTPVLVLRFEADNESAIARIQARFKEQLLAVDSSLNIPF